MTTTPNLRYFTVEEFDCQHTGNNRMDPVFLARLDALRDACGFPFRITSGYRDPSHPVEAKKKKSGTHSQGIAADIAVADAAQRRILVAQALRLGFNGVGVARGFIHVDIRETTPVLWLYH